MISESHQLLQLYLYQSSHIHQTFHTPISEVCTLTRHMCALQPQIGPHRAVNSLHLVLDACCAQHVAVGVVVLTPADPPTALSSDDISSDAPSSWLDSLEFI